MAQLQWEISDDEIALVLQDLGLPNGELDIEEARGFINEDEIISEVMEYDTFEKQSSISYELLTNQLKTNYFSLSHLFI